MEQMTDVPSWVFSGRSDVDITILRIDDPVNIIIKEVYGPRMSKSALDFRELENILNEQFQKFIVEFTDRVVPLRGTFVLVHTEKGNWRRGKVECILATSTSSRVRVYLVDYGTYTSVPQDRVWLLPPVLALVPFQAVHFSLLGLQPLSLFETVDLCLQAKPSEKWDTSALEFVQKTLSSGQIQVEAKGMDDNNHVHGCIYKSDRVDRINLNEVLISRGFAWYNKHAAAQVTALSALSLSSRLTDEELASVPAKNAPNPRPLGVKNSWAAQVDQFLHNHKPAPPAKFIDMAALQKKVQRDAMLLSEETISFNHSTAEEPKHKDLVKLPELIPMHSKNCEASSVLPPHNSFYEAGRISSQEPTEQPSPSSRPSSVQTSTSGAVGGSHCTTEQPSLSESPPSKAELLRQALRSSALRAPNPALSHRESDSPNRKVKNGHRRENKRSPPVTGSQTLQENTRQTVKLDPDKNVTGFWRPGHDNLSQGTSIQTLEDKPSEDPDKGVGNLLREQANPSHAVGLQMSVTNFVPKATMPSPVLVKDQSKSDKPEQCESAASRLRNALSASTAKTSPSYLHSCSAVPSICLSTSSEDNTLHDSKAKPSSKINSSLRAVKLVETKTPECSTAASLQGLSQILRETSSVVMPDGSNHCSDSSDQVLVHTSEEVKKVSHSSADINLQAVSPTKPHQVPSAVKLKEKLSTACDSPCGAPVCLSEDAKVTIRTTPSDDLLNGSNGNGTPSPKVLNPISVDARGADPITNFVTPTSTKTNISPLALKLLNAVAKGAALKSMPLPGGSVNPTSGNDGKVHSDCKNGTSTAQRSNEVNSDHKKYILSPPLSSEDCRNQLQFVEKLPISPVLRQNEESEARLELVPPETESILTQSWGSTFFKTELASQLNSNEPRAMRHGQRLPKPMCRLEYVPFALVLKEHLNSLSFPGPSIIQSVMWPAAFRGRSFVTIAPPHSGKTLGYLIPLLSNLVHQSSYDDLPLGNGPLVVIICSSWTSVQRAALQCDKLISSDMPVRVITLHAGGSEDKQIPLINGCEILIATPGSILRLMKAEGYKTINLRRCCHLVFDDGDTLVEDHTSEVQDILREYVDTIKTRKTGTSRFQVILCAEMWTRGVESFLRNCTPDPLLFISSLYEATVYAHVPTYVTMCDPKQRLRTLTNLVENLKGKKMVICTSDDAEAQVIYNCLQSQAVFTLLANRLLPHYELQGVMKEWNMQHAMFSHPVLVAADSILQDLQIIDADCLIHYDYPDVSRFQFGNRHHCLIQHFRDLTKLPKNENITSDCVNHLIVTRDCKPQAEKLVGFLRRLQALVPDELVQLAVSHRKSLVSKVELCQELKAFGRCQDQRRCQQRHFVSAELDTASDLPTSGRVRVLITHVISAARYYVRILEVQDPTTGKKSTVEDAFKTLHSQLAAHYKDASNRVPHENVQDKDLCAIRSITQAFCRVQVIALPEKDPSIPFGKACVRFLETGATKLVSVNELLQLRDDLKVPRACAVETHLCCVIPPDNDRRWTIQASMYVHSLICGKEMIADIALCLGHTLWLNPLVAQEYLPEVDATINTLHVAAQLKKKGFAKANPHHLQRLYSLCEGKIPLPPKREEIVKQRQKLRDVKEASRMAWAFLEKTAYQDVYVSAVETPEHFFVQRADTCQCLDNLVENINEAVQDNQLEKLNEPEEGMLCIAPFHMDGRFQRARIEKITFPEPDQDTEVDSIEVGLFFVDVGDTGPAKKKDLYRIPQKLQDVLPLQAIECSLGSVAPLGDRWTEDAGDAFWTMTLEDGDMNKRLVAKILGISTSCCTGGKCYVVELYDTHDDVDLVISQELAKQGLAKPLPISTDVVHAIEEMQCNASCGQEDCEGSEDEMMPEEKEIANEFCKMLLVSLRPGLIEEISAAFDKDDEDDVQLYRQNWPSIKSSEDSHATDYLPVPLPADLPPLIAVEGVTESRTPEVQWYQTKDTVELRLLVAGVRTFELVMTSETVTFSTIVGKHLYGLIVDLFATIDETRSVGKAEGLKVVIRLHKAEAGVTWPRLVKSKEKSPHIKYSYDHIDCSSEDESDPDPYPKVDPESVDLMINNSDDSSNSEEEEVDEEELLVDHNDIFDRLH